MKAILFAILFSFSSLLLFWWPAEAAIRDYLEHGKLLYSEIKTVTLYANLARVTRSGELKEIKPGSKGRTWVHLEKLTGKIKKDSFRVELVGTKQGRVAQVVVEDLFDFAPMTDEVRKMRQQLFELYGKRLDLIQQLQLARGELDFLGQLKYFHLPPKVEEFPPFKASYVTLNKAIDLITANRDKSFTRLQAVIRKQQDNQEEIELLLKKLENHTDLRQQKWMTHLFVQLEHKKGIKNLKGKIKVSYLIEGARWRPGYDIRATLKRAKGEAKIRLVSSGLVSQNSDEQWNDVGLYFSTIDPSPLFRRKLDRWVLAEQRQEMPMMEQEEGMFSAMMDSSMEGGRSIQAPSEKKMRRKSIRARKKKEAMRRARHKRASRKARPGMSLGAMASAPPMVQMASDMRKESVMKGKLFPFQSLKELFPQLGRTVGKIARLEGATIKGRRYDGRVQTYRRGRAFPESGGREIKMHAPLKSTVEHHQPPVKIPIATRTLNARLHYFAIPKHDQRVYLQAVTRNDTAFPLLNGDAQVFMNGDLVSRTTLKNIAAKGEFTIDLGEDPNIETKRVVTKEAGSAGMIVKSHSTTVKVELEIKNNHKFPITISLKDQYPLSPHTDLKVELLQVTPKPTSVSQGVMSWNKLKVSQGKKINLNFSYRVNHPKDWIVSEFN